MDLLKDVLGENVVAAALVGAAAIVVPVVVSTLAPSPAAPLRTALKRGSACSTGGCGAGRAVRLGRAGPRGALPPSCRHTQAGDRNRQARSPEECAAGTRPRFRDDQRGLRDRNSPDRNAPRGVEGDDLSASGSAGQTRRSGDPYAAP
jgi:hypothetical protein